MDPALQLLIGAAVTIVSQLFGYAALARKLEAKADRQDHESLVRRVVALERAHGDR